MNFINRQFFYKILRIRKKMYFLKIDAFLFLKLSSIKYLFNNYNYNYDFFILLTMNYIFIFGNFFDKNYINNIFFKKQIIFIKNFSFKFFFKILKKNKIIFFYFDDNLNFLKFNNKFIKQYVFLKNNNFINEFRIIKDKYEIKNLEKACFITDKAFIFVLNIVYIGMREIDLYIRLKKILKSFKFVKIAFDILISSGKRSSFIHGKPSNKRICFGDIIMLDFGCSYNNYNSDMTRTFFVGKINEKVKNIYNIIYNIQNFIISKIKLNMKFKKLDILTRKILKNLFLEKYFLHSIGHGIGIEVHERPLINKKDYLYKNSVITIEPGIYIKNFFGIRIEDVILINKNIKILTKSSKKIIII